jgi:hypothetical protein
MSDILEGSEKVLEPKHFEQPGFGLRNFSIILAGTLHIEEVDSKN